MRYGQIKRKLGLDTWNLAKPKDGNDENAGEDAAPETPTTTRAKKSVSTPGTGAGVKKRASTGKRTATSGTARGRKTPKSRALFKMDDDRDSNELANDLDMEENDNGMLGDPESPTRNIKKQGGGGAARIKPEFGSVNSTTNNNLNFIAPEFADFPLIIPDVVLERKAILVSLSGAWTVSPAPLDVHAQWLARLPAHIQTQFYAQAQGHSTVSASSGGDTAAAQLMHEAFEAQHPGNLALHHSTAVHGGASMGLPVSMAIDMGYMPAAGAGAAVGNGQGGNGEIDLHSIPMHPSYIRQLEQEQRDQEARDQETLFGGGVGADHQDDY